MTNEPAGGAASKFLLVSDIVAGYGVSDTILNGASLEVREGEIVSIIGPNGAGKSTFLKAVAGLLAVKSGRIQLAGKDITREGAVGRAKAGVSFVPQENNVFGRLSVSENLIISSYMNPSQAKARQMEMYERYPLLYEKRDALARSLSGGQRQILAMAMGLITRPRILLLDEPTAGLSPKAADQLFEVIVALNRTGLPILMVEQHALEALEISTRAYVFVSGRNTVDGPGPALGADPEVRRLFLGG